MSPIEQISELEQEIATALDSHPDGEIFRSFFRSPDAVICAATLLTEIGDCRGRYRHRDPSTWMPKELTPSAARARRCHPRTRCPFRRSA
jgi:hypothetical protein